MPDEARLIGAFILALGVAFATTPLAIAVATRTGFYDQPGGGLEYKIHRSPTPYLGGVAVVVGFLVAGLTVSDALVRLWPIVACTVALFLLGTVDDRVNLSARLRLTLEVGLAAILWWTDLGWSVFGSDALNLIATSLWVVGVANAFNLMDNMDGVTAAVGAVTALGTAILAVIGGDPELAILCLGLSGACFGFLPYNARGPARIFLGDGGSLPIGFVIAATIMAIPDGDGLGWSRLLLAPLLAGLPVADTALRIIWRRRAGVPIDHGTTDSITHILSRRLGSPRRVALILACGQAGVAMIAIGAAALGQGSVVLAWALWFATTAVAVFLLEAQAWKGSPIVSRPSAPRSRPEATAVRRPASAPKISPVEAAVIIFITTVCGLSPALFGFYKLSVWGPIALFVLASLLGLVIARPAKPRATALVAIGGLVLLWLWSLASTGWAESVDQALLDANRWLLYAALFAVLVLLLRDDRLSALLIGTATLAVVAFGGYLCIRLVLPGAEEFFLARRLDDPLGYINGQAGYLLLGLWPLVAFAERIRSHALAGGAIGAAIVLAGLALLGQTRAVVPAVVISGILLVALLPGRRARIWALLAIAAGVALAAVPLLDVYESGDAETGLPDPDVLQRAVIVLVGVAVTVGTLAALARMSWSRLTQNGSQRWDRIATAATAGVCGVLLVGLLLAGGDPVDRARDEARAFKNLETNVSPDKNRFTSGKGNRYDYWRIAGRQFKDHPVKGIGAGNYDRTYFVERRSIEDVRQPHSIVLQVLSELGLVGGLGLLLFLGAVLLGFARRAREARTSPASLGLAVAGGGMFLLWLVHTSVDWLHLIPGLTGIALCGAAVLVAPWAVGNSVEQRTGLPVRLVVIGLCGLVVLAGAALVSRLTLADKYRSDAQDIVHSDPRGALAKASDSLALNDEALSTYYTEAAAYARLGDYQRARGSLLEAGRREPHDFVTWGLLGDLALRRGDLRQARRDYGRASELNPRDRTLKRVARDPRLALDLSSR